MRWGVDQDAAWGDVYAGRLHAHALVQLMFTFVPELVPELDCGRRAGEENEMGFHAIPARASASGP